MKKFLLRIWIFAALTAVSSLVVKGQTPVTFNPIKNAVDVPVDKVLTISFDQIISKGTGGLIQIVNSSSLEAIGNYYVSTGYTSTEVSVVGNLLSIDPYPAFEMGVEYYVTIASGVISGFGGIDNSAGNNWRFTIVEPPLEISGYDPLQNSTDVALDKTLTLTFSQTISKGTGGAVQIVRNSDLTVVGNYFLSTGFTSSELTVSGNQLIINPQFSFDEGELYYVLIGNNAIEGFTGIDNSEGNNWRFTTIEPAPAIVSYDPLQGATGVPVDKILTLTFDRTISKGSWGLVEIVRSSDLNVLGSYLISSGYTSSEITVSGTQLIINPTPNFSELEEYYVTIASGAISGFDGIDNSTGNNWRFTIVNPPLEISGYDPLQNETDVALDKTLTLTFSQTIGKGTGGVVQIVRNSDLTVVGDYFMSTGFTSSELTVSGNQLTINPQFSFDEGELYYVIIGNNAIEGFTGIDNSEGNNWRFTTLEPAPAIVSYDPLQGATGVPVDKILTLTFDRTISKGAGGVVQVVRTSDLSVLGDYFISTIFTSSEISLVGNRLVINPIPNFSESEEYYVTIASGAISGFGGIDNSAGNNWRFNIVNPPLEISSYDPLQNSTDVALDKTLTLTFSQTISKGTGGAVQIVRNSDLTVVGDYFMSTGFTSSELTVSANQLIINPQFSFDEGELYYVIIGNNAIEGFTGIDNSEGNNWRFTTIEPAPAIVSYDPLQGATGVPVDKVLTLTFDRTISKGSGGVVEIVRSSDLNVLGSYLISSGFTSTEIIVSGNQLTINPIPDFSESEEYFVTIENGAISGFLGIDNSEGNNWRFSISGGVPPEIVPGSLTPIPGTIEVSRNPVLSVAFNENIVIGTSGYFKIFDSSDNEIATVPRTSGMVSIVDDVLTVSLTSIALPYGADCYVVIDPGFVRSAATGVNFPGISDPAYWYFTTETAPPFWAAGYPSITSQNADNFTFNGQTDQSGDMYFVVTGTGVPAPTAEQISLGLNGSGAAAKIVFSSAMAANTPLSAEVAFNVATPQGTSYYLYAVAYSGEKAGDIIRIDIDRTAPIIEPGLSYPSNGATTVPVDAEISIVFSEMIYGYVGPGVEPIDASYFSLQASGVDVPFSFAVSANGEVVTLTPLATLTDNTAYTVTIQPIADEYGNSTSIITRTFETDKLNQWIGNGVVSDWVDPLNWSDGSFVSGKSVIVTATATAFPVIDNETVDVYNLTVEAGAAVTLSGGNLNISGVYNLQSSSSVNASFIHTSGTLTVDPANVQIDQVVSDPAVTYFFSSPVSGATPNSIQTTNVVYQFDNSTGQYSIVSGTSAFEAGRGYATRSTQPLVFSGSINQGSFDYTVNRSALGFGWNLVGNPYPASIDWTALTNTNLEDAFWIWNQDGGNYGVYNAGITTNQVTGPIIPSNQGFLVKVLLGQTEGAVGFNTVALVQNSNSYLKSAGGVVPHIKLAGINGSYRDEVAFAVSSISSYGTDRLDTEKYFSTTSGLFELYSKVGDMPTVISGYPQDELIEIPLGYKAKTAGNYTIEITKNVMPNYTVVLFDSTTGSQIDFTNGGSYDFSVESAGSDISRFKVVLSRQTTDIGSIANDDKVTLYVNDRSLFVTIESAGGNSDYQLFDIKGRLMRKGLLINAETNRIDGLATGTYVLRIINNDKSVSNHKVLVY